MEWEGVRIPRQYFLETILAEILHLSGKKISHSGIIILLIIIEFTSLTGELVPKSVVDVVTIVGDVVDVKEVVSIVVKEENVLIRLLRLLEKVILPSKNGKQSIEISRKNSLIKILHALRGGKGGAETSSLLPMLETCIPESLW